MLSKNANAVTSKRYFHEAETWSTLSLRVAVAVSAYEKRQSYWADRFGKAICDLEFIPGGRILRNAGMLKAGMLNCACLPVGDSIEEIGECIKNALILWSYGAGIGIDFTPLRSKGRPLVSKGGNSSGMVSFVTAIDRVAKKLDLGASGQVAFLKAIDMIASTIETGGQRRSGCLGMSHIRHPEIREFISAKVADGDLSYFNLSVAIDGCFLRAVEEGAPWDLVSQGVKEKTVDAQELWDFILKCMVTSAEPGLINQDRMMLNNSYFFAPISAPNLCSEIPLPPFGSCCLGALVLPKFVRGTSTDWKGLAYGIETGLRFLDDVLDVNTYPLVQMEQVAKQGRRVGLGVMGLHDYLMAKHVCYGSEQGLEEIEKLFKFIRDTAYRCSADLAKEKGAFPAYKTQDFIASSFVRRLPPKLRRYIKESGVRNVCMISAQPSGTTSLIPECSSGIEPVYALAYERKDRVSDRVYIHPKYVEHLESGEKTKPDWLVDSSNLAPEDHLDVQVVIQKYVDNAVSKTINCPKGTTEKDLSKLLLEYMRDLVGVTVYVDGTKEGQILNALSYDEAKKRLKSANKEAAEAVECRSGSCDL